MCVNPVQVLTGLFSGGGGGGGDSPAPVAPPPLPPIPQAAKTPGDGTLKRKPLGGPLPAPAGGTLLTGTSGISDAALTLGGTSLLGGGKG
jgi:hypothetical protein